MASDSRTQPRILPWLLAVTLPLYILDQISKFWIVKNFPVPWSDDPRTIWVAEEWFRIIRVHNQGVAFGMGNGSTWAPIVFMFVPILAVTLIVIGLRKNFFEGKVGMLSVALLLAGIFGNFTDRLVQGSLLPGMEDASLWERLRFGYVVDFVHVWLPGFGKIMKNSGGWWPAFNVADSCICVAAVLLFISGWRAEQAKEVGKPQARRS